MAPRGLRRRRRGLRVGPWVLLVCMSLRTGGLVDEERCCSRGGVLWRLVVHQDQGQGEEEAQESETGSPPREALAGRCAAPS